MSVRLNFIVEGQTEEAFVNRTLRPHLAKCSIWVNARCVMTGQKGRRKYRGGIRAYEQARRDILLWAREDQKSDARFTTMFDLYGLPSDFPEFQRAVQIIDPYERARVLQDGLASDIDDWRLIPYLQLHEFEALLLSKPVELNSQFVESCDGVDRLVEMASCFESPELIDSGAATAPSKRIIREIPEYEGRKASAGPIIAGKIGLPTLRSKCRHFRGWLDRLESLE